MPQNLKNCEYHFENIYFKITSYKLYVISFHLDHSANSPYGMCVMSCIQRNARSALNVHRDVLFDHHEDAVVRDGFWESENLPVCKYNHKCRLDINYKWEP